MGPEHHDVIIHEIVKEPGERVSNEELNNAINVDNKDHANVNEGVSLPQIYRVIQRKQYQHVLLIEMEV